MSKNSTRISTFGSQATSVVSVALTLLILGVLALAAVGASRLTDNVRRGMTVTVQAVPGANNLQLNHLKRVIGRYPSVDSYSFKTSEAILAEEVKYMGQEISTLLDENPYGAEYEIHLKPTAACTDSILKITRYIMAQPAVDRVLTDTTVVESVNSSFTRLAWVLGGIAAALMLISCVLINNTVSLSIYSRRFLIRTMKLVGATPGFIRRPFVRAGVVNGLIAGLTASLLLCGAQVYALQSFPDAAVFLDWGATATVCAGLTVLGVILCAGAAAIATTRYLHRNYDSLYRK